MLKKSLYWRQYRYFGQRPNKVPFPNASTPNASTAKTVPFPRRPRRKVFIFTVLQR